MTVIYGLIGMYDSEQKAKKDIADFDKYNQRPASMNGSTLTYVTVNL